MHKPKVIVISGLLDKFLQEPNIDIGEFESLISKIVPALRKINCDLPILSLRPDLSCRHRSWKT